MTLLYQHTFLNVSLCSSMRGRSIHSWYANVLDDREDVEDIVWANGSFTLVVEEVVSQSQLVWGEQHLIKFFICQLL